MVMVQLTPAGRQMLDEIETSATRSCAGSSTSSTPRQLTGVATAMADLRDAVEATFTGHRRPPSRQPSPREGLIRWNHSPLKPM